jgi:hypothetical protein
MVLIGINNNMSKGADHGMTPKVFRHLVWVGVYAVAFAWVEGSVVVYLREIFYKGSFNFPITVNWDNGKYVSNYLTSIETVREAATIIMLAAVGCLSGRSNWQKFSYFMIAFGVWDIFYYVWLYVMIGWPEGLMTWDILFLIPLPWTAPVIAPVLISLAMIAAGTLIIYCDDKGIRLKFFWYDWSIIMGCGLIMIISFCWDWKNIVQLPDGLERSGIPNPFLWGLFLPAYILSVSWFSFRLFQNVKKIS